MADKMRILELCLRESATAYQWGGKNNCLSCSKGVLSFILMVQAGLNTIDYTLSYRLTEFDRIYRMLTSATLFPGLTLTEGEYPLESWSLMNVSMGMRTLTGKMDTFADELAGRVTTPEENMRFEISQSAGGKEGVFNIDRR